MAFRCFLKSSSEKATIIAKKTATTAINVLNGTVIELSVNSVADEVGDVVGFDDDVGFGEVDVEIEPSDMVIVCVLLQSLV